MANEKRTNGRLIGYARVSTADQSVQMQVDALKQAGVIEDNLHIETVSGVAKSRPAYQDAIQDARQGDTLVVWKLDRIARSMIDLLKKIEQLESCQIMFRSITEDIDTTSPGGGLLVHVLGALSQFECDLISERSRAGVRAARARGKQIGAKKKLSDDDVPKAIKMWDETTKTRDQVAAEFGVSGQTLYNRRKKYETELAVREKSTRTRKQRRKV